MPPLANPCKLTFDLLTLKSKVVSESRVTWATSVPILVFLELGPMYATDMQTDVKRASSLDAAYPRGGGMITQISFSLSKVASI